MEKVLHKVYKKVGIKSNRTKNITKHVLLSSLFKLGSIISSFLLVPLTITYLDAENYGIWLTLSSFIAWFSFFDIGLGNGLRNKFAEAKAKGDMTLARGYVSSAYFTIGSVSLCLILIFFGLNFFINWASFFNAPLSLQKDLMILMPIVFGFFCLQLVVKLIATIYTADQENSMQEKFNFFTQAGSLVLIWIMTKTSESSLLIFGIIFSSFPFFILLGLNLFAFNRRYKLIKPSISLWKKVYLKPIFGLGFRFFLIQISGLIIFSTDSLIISKMVSPVEVVPYQIAFKYFSITTMIFTILSSPYWSGFTEAIVKDDKYWVNNSLKILIKISFLFIFGVLVLLVFSSWLYKFWIGDKVHIPISLSVLMAVYFIMSLLITPFTIFINATGKVYLQTCQSIFSALINIPLSIFFVKYYNMGSSGVILGTIISLLPSLLLAPLQTWKINKSSSNKLYNK